MTTFNEGGVTADITLTHAEVSGAHEYSTRTMHFTLVVSTPFNTSEEVHESTEWWYNDSSSGGEGFGGADLFNLIKRPEDPALEDAWFALEENCDDLWDEVEFWFSNVAGEISAAQKAVVPEFIERANDGAFDRAVSA